MKLSTVFKALGATALAVSLLPHKVSTDEETGELKIDALLWHATKDAEGTVSVSLGLDRPSAEDDDYDDDDLKDLFDEDSVVEYTATQGTFPDECEEDAGEDASEEDFDDCDTDVIPNGVKPVCKRDYVYSEAEALSDNCSYEKTAKTPDVSAEAAPAAEKKDSEEPKEN